MLQYRSEISVPKHTRNTRMPIRVYAYAHTRIRVCLHAYTKCTKYTHMLITIYEPVYCFFLCNTVVECVVPENIHTSPTEGIFLITSPPLWKFQLSSTHFFKIFGLKEPPTPRKFQSLLWGEYGYFLELHNVVSLDVNTGIIWADKIATCQTR